MINQRNSHERIKGPSLTGLPGRLECTRTAGAMEVHRRELHHGCTRSWHEGGMCSDRTRLLLKAVSCILGTGRGGGGAMGTFEGVD